MDTESRLFEKKFFSLAELLGCTETDIIANIGQPDDSLTNEYGTRFVFFERFGALFTISSDSKTGIYVSSPDADVKGTKILPTNSNFTIQGITIGATRSVLLEKWGSPTKEYELVWVYGTKSGQTKCGKQYELSVTFDSDNPDVVTGFEARLKKDDSENEAKSIRTERPNSGCFIATACYGNDDSIEINILRRYRDEVLSKIPFGGITIELYYLLSPPLANLIYKSSFLKQTIRRYILNKLVVKIRTRRNW